MSDVLNLRSEPASELTDEFYTDQLTKRGLMKNGKFVRNHPQFLSNTPTTTTKKNKDGFQCPVCDKICKTKAGLIKHGKTH